MTYNNLFSNNFVLLLTDAEKNEPIKSGSYTAVTQIFYIILMLGFILVLAYVSAKIANKSGAMNGKNLKVIEKISTSTQSNIQLIRAGKKYILIGVTKDKISLLSEIDAEDIVIEDSSGSSNQFSDYLENFLQRYKK